MLSYSEVWNALKETDEDPRNPNNVILLYTNESRSKNLNGGNVGDWNREHVWAKSHGDFGTSKGPGTDIHHLRPADVQVNSARGNMDFDNGGTEYAKAPGNYYDGDSWEPRDDVKGDVARMLFYMAVRYEGDDGYPDLELNDKTGNGSAPYHGKQSVLLEWNKQDPVDDRERKRNEIIYENISTTAIHLSTTLNGRMRFGRKKKVLLLRSTFSNTQPLPFPHRKRRRGPFSLRAGLNRLHRFACFRPGGP